MRRRMVPITIAAAVAIGLVGCAPGGQTTPQGDDQVKITIESYRVDDAAVWTNTILPAFMEEHPNILVEFQPTKATDYDAALVSKFKGGTAGDVVFCRSGEINRANIAEGYLDPVSELDGLGNFDPLALSFWADPDGTPYCVPMVGVSSGMFYNKDIFDELSLEEPETVSGLMDLLQEVKDDGKYVPLALGATSADSWVLDRIVLSGLGQNFWKGEVGRQGLKDGSKKFTDQEFVDALSAVADLAPFMPEGYAGIAAADAKQLFVLGQAAVLPTGSWDINAISADGLNIGLFAPPVQRSGDPLHMQSHPDHGMGINAAGKNKKEAQIFVEWIASPEFSKLYGDALPGFFSLSNAAEAPENELGREFAELLSEAELSPRLGHDTLLAGGNPDFVTQMTNLLQLMMTGDTSPKEVAAKQQEQLESWYPPQQG